MVKTSPPKFKLQEIINFVEQNYNLTVSGKSLVSDIAQTAYGSENLLE